MILNSSKISPFIENQFPGIYREDAREMIVLVEAYYKFLEETADQSVYQTRRIRDNIDIDYTMQSMLIFYQNKFLSGLPMNNDPDLVRFTVKHILDLYRRKGSKEGITLFFQMFYDENIEIFYPSEAMIKPSSSRWKSGDFIQLYPNADSNAYSDLVGLKIYGLRSKAEAYVEAVQFVNVYGSSIPIIFLDRVRGEFVGLERIFTHEDERVNRGRIYGSLQSITNIIGMSGNNAVGDIVEVIGDKGFNGQAIVTEVNETISGEITFSITSGDFGYTADGNTEIILSNQNLLFTNIDTPFIIEEEVSQVQGNTTVYGTVIGQSTSALGILLANTDQPFEVGDFETTERSGNTNITRTAELVTGAIDANSSAYAEVSAIDNAQTIEVVTDIIGDYLTVNLDDPIYLNGSNTSMSGGNTNANTSLNEAFGPIEMTIGRISQLGGIIPGIDYNSSPFAIAKQSTIIRFDKKDQILTYDYSTSQVSIFENDILTQTRDILEFGGNTVPVTVLGVVDRIEGDHIFVKLRSFYEFTIDANSDITKSGSTEPLLITNISVDNNSEPMGRNAVIAADADYIIGQIEAVRIINSGIAYEHGSSIQLKSVTANNEYDATGTVVARGQGIAEGRWVTTTSHLNYDWGKRIQDSNYYQDFSYEVALSMNEDDYLEELLDTAHPAGIKLFTKFALFESINTEIEILSEIEQSEI